MRFQLPWTNDAPAVETRADGYADALVSALLRTAQGRSTATIAATGALEAAAGIVGRAFMAADVTGPMAMLAGLSAPVLQMVGREIIRRGESVFLIDTNGGALRLLPAHGVNVSGGPFPESWRYQLTIAGPSTTLTYDDVPAESVLHFQYASDPASPWRGVGPLQVAALAGRLSAETIAALADESSGPRGSFLPLPADGGDGSDDDTLKLMKADIKTANGGMLTVETTNDDWRQGGSGPQFDWKAERFGANPPQGMIELLKQSRMEVWNACGLHSALWDAADSRGVAGSVAHGLVFGSVAVGPNAAIRTGVEAGRGHIGIVG